jgi:uncharacterized membrane protein
MEQYFKHGQFEAGVLYGIEQIGQALTQYYPTNGSNQNELPNAPVVM